MTTTQGLMDAYIKFDRPTLTREQIDLLQEIYDALLEIESNNPLASGCQIKSYLGSEPVAVEFRFYRVRQNFITHIINLLQQFFTPHVVNEVRIHTFTRPHRRP